MVLPRSMAMLSRSMVSWEGRAVDDSTRLAGVLASILNISLGFSPALAIITLLVAFFPKSPLNDFGFCCAGSSSSSYSTMVMS